MTTKTELLSTLPHFTGTTKWYRLAPYVLLTDGTYFLADKANSYWLMDLFASHMTPAEGFAVLHMNVNDDTADVVIDDGDGRVIAKQHIPYTDFPLDSIKLYGAWEEDNLIIMLPTEY